MDKILSAKSPEDLNAIVNLVHDRYFLLDDIAHDNDLHTVSIPFRSRSHINRDDAGPYRTPLTIVIRNVVSFTVNDTERVKWYDFNTFRYDVKTAMLSISTGVPILITCKVSALHVELSGRDA